MISQRNGARIHHNALRKNALARRERFATCSNAVRTRTAVQTAVRTAARDRHSHAHAVRMRTA
eukprot:7726241-Lingulodinium_polyedra.AAC.1